MDSKAFFNSFNQKVEKAMPFVTPLGVILGLVLGEILAPLKPLVTWLFAFITLVGAMGMLLSDFSALLKSPMPIVVSIGVTHIVMPLVAWGAGSLIFPREPLFVTGFVLLYSIPTAVVGYMWANIFKGNGVLSLTLILTGTLLAPLVTPMTVRLLTRSDVKIDTMGMMVSLLWMVVVPSIIGVVFNTLGKGWAKRNVAPYLKPFTKIALFLEVMINASSVAGRFSVDGDLVKVILVNVVFAAMGYLFGLLFSRTFRFSRDSEVSIVFSTGMRNTSASLVLAVTFFPPETAIPVLAGILMQQMTAAVMGKILFGKE